MSDIIGELLLTNDKVSNSLNWGHLEALILWFYNNKREYRKKIDLLGKDDKGNLTTPIKSKLLKENESLANYFEDIDKKDYYDLNLDFLLDKINLSQPIITH